MDTLLAAARLGDPIAHTASKGWMIAGLIAGAVIGAVAVVATGGAALTVVAAVAAGAAAGGGLGEVLGTMSWAPRHVTGSLMKGSPNVFINSRAAMRAILSLGLCSDHAGPPQVVAQGSSTVFINSQPASRKEDRMMCGALINDGSPNVFIGGPRSVSTIPRFRRGSTGRCWLSAWRRLRCSPGRRLRFWVRPAGSSAERSARGLAARCSAKGQTGRSGRCLAEVC